MRPRGLSTIVSHFSEVLPRRALNDVCAANPAGGEAADALGLNDVTLPSHLRAASVSIQEMTRAAVLDLLRTHGINPEEPSAMDALNSYLLGDDNPFMTNVQSLVLQALEKYQEDCRRE
jgi:hypothetical protein